MMAAAPGTSPAPRRPQTLPADPADHRTTADNRPRHGHYNRPATAGRAQTEFKAMSHRSIRPRVLSGLVTMSAVILAAAACSSSGSSTPSGTNSPPSSAMGTKTLVVESTPLSPLTNTVVLNFAAPQAGNFFLIGTQAIVSQHVWQSVSNPATYSDASPVGTGPYVLDKFSPQGILLKANPTYWNKSQIHVPEIDFPSYVSNTAAEQALESGQID